MTINPASIGALCANRATGHGTGPNDQYFSNVVALLHCNGTNGATTLTNSCSRGNLTWTCNSGCTLTTTSPEYGSACLDCAAGNGGVFSVSGDYQIGSGDFTLEWSFWTTSYQDTYMLDLGNSAPAVRFDPKGTSNRSYIEVNGSALLGNVAASLLTLSAWNKCAVTRVGSTMYYFVGGVLCNSASNSSNISGNEISIGKSHTAGFPGSGKFDEIRVTKGVGRYTATYAPATGPFPDF